ncbi:MULTISPECIES: dethiobiotin synthase [Caldimonas]|uniref:dethiobiotin synthase n=1 Tax=Caldimonas TaxID=196013 RepID=UPI00035E36C2|nr:dethiobiotin synthase [Caldimonas manganoxidans]MCX7659464.1 dethiobiotin synthase [Caldimonas manganoxidans]GIX22907.1 MAG: ATP-dependent dethiobiotin synthetase BioD [Caldimonas sp.]
MKSLQGWFVTGTDTEIGKTTISAGLLHALGRRGWRVAGYKPVAAGTQWREGRRVNDDIERLRAASTEPLDAEEVCACLLDAACAPHVAARQAGVSISLQALLDGAQRLAGRLDRLIVEGVGGFLVPLDEQHDTAELAVRLGLPVILVVGLRLGCLNHALLTAEAVRARGLRLAGWVGNAVDPRMPWRQDNVETLRLRMARDFEAPCVGVVPPLSEPHAAAVAAHLDPSVLEPG